MKNSQANEYVGEKFLGRGNRKSNSIKSRKKPGIFEKQIQSQWHWSLMTMVEGNGTGKRAEGRFQASWVLLIMIKGLTFI